MKTGFLLFAFFAIVTLSVSAQSNYSNYLNKALSSIENGDCEAAKKWYNVYKDLSGKTVSSVEALIQDCNSDTTRKYNINDKITVDNLLYRVAYIEDNGAHGFAIYDFGVGSITAEMINDRKLPTRAEMILIAKTAKILNIYTDMWYWTLDRYGDYSNYIMKLETLTLSKDYRYYTASHGIILIYRF